MEQEFSWLGSSSCFAVASAEAWARWRPSGHLCLVICKMRLMMLPLAHGQDSSEVQSDNDLQSLPGSGHMWEGCALVHWASGCLAAPSHDIQPSQVASAEPGGPCWLAECQSSQVLCCIPCTNLLLFQIKHYLGVGNGRGNCAKSAFIMEEINISRVIYLFLKDINF